MQYDLNRPWLTLDPWQKEYINTDPNQPCFLLCPRQSGKTTAMAIKAVDLCVKHFKKGEFVMINSITEKQAYILLARALSYAKEVYPKLIVLKENKKKGWEKPTKHKFMFTNGTAILCYAAGESGEGLRGFTIKKHMVDEGSRMSDEFFVATSPALSVVKGSQDIASTPCGAEGYFYECSKNDYFKKFYISAEDCPRHTKEFLEKEKAWMSELQYAQEYEAKFLDSFRRLYKDNWIKKVNTLPQSPISSGSGIAKPALTGGDLYLGVDVGGLGEDISTFEGLMRHGKVVTQFHHETTSKTDPVDTSDKIISLDVHYDFKGIGLDDGGMGVGVLAILLRHDATKYKTIGLNNARRVIDSDERDLRLHKEAMYINMLVMGETGELTLFKNDEIIASLRSIQVEKVRGEWKIVGKDKHCTEGLIRGCWMAKEKELNMTIWSIRT